MRKPSLTAANKKFIKANRLKMSGSAMAKLFGVGKSVVGRYIKKNGLTIPHELAIKFRADAMRGKTTSTPAIDRFLKANYLTINVNQLSIKVKRSETFVKCRLRQLGLIIPQEIIEQRKRDSQIKPGDTPPNKGKKMAAAVYKRCKATMFKKGQASINKRPLGSMRVTKDGYLEIKIMEPNKWQPYHRLMWEETFGPIPKGKVVRFITDDKMNVHPFNLELIGKRENMLKNSVQNLPKPIALAVQLRGALNRQINKHIKRLKNEKQAK